MSLAVAVITSGLHTVVSLVLATVVDSSARTAELVAVTSIHGLGSHVPEIASATAIGFIESILTFAHRG